MLAMYRKNENAVASPQVEFGDGATDKPGCRSYDALDNDSLLGREGLKIFGLFAGEGKLLAFLEPHHFPSVALHHKSIAGFQRNLGDVSKAVAHGTIRADDIDDVVPVVAQQPRFREGFADDLRSGGHQPLRQEATLDRKSTRLNS